ncbi:barren [Didymella exigua CBS 183.55]|uniref:Condensin complex subunit 2 n=1 Tax=Didymella exigua CBS 183.55 TaxID=1150837 RepID=A0A6A5RXB1_9PLEO|nr:barren [Didymella exigua CBS 183.55]KAF1929897.1 barren [Didymella exigua CBS 183.55]
MARSRYSLAPQATPAKGQKVPLNDDDEERAKRRHAFAERQRNELRHSTTPNSKKKGRRSLAAQVIDPSTPTQDHDMPDVAGNAVTPMKRVLPLASNFEDWIKMATDNKINAANSWNFALIDYFHEMSLLKEGDGVNFQKASCTLDGCVKIYTSRVDSVATDTGKLLSGLAENGNKKSRGGDEEDEDGEDVEGEEGEDGQKKKRKRAVRSAESTLATSFEQLQNKKMDLEFAQDPLFKKATADFDEGGAKGLLMNHLAIDANGRIVFDSSDDAGDKTTKESAEDSAPGETPVPEEAAEETPSSDIDIDISGLAAKYFPNLAILDEQDVCPSMKTFDLGDVNGSMDLPFLKAPDDWRQDEKDADEDEAGNVTGVFLDDNNAGGFDDDDDNLGGFQMADDVGFGEGGDAFAQELALVPNARVHNNGEEAEGDEPIESVEGQTGSDEQQYALTMNHARDQEHENILSYFDQALKKNWAGPEHWRIRRVKEAGKVAPVTKRKEKEPFEIDFLAPMSQELANALYTPATSASTILLPRAQWKSKSKNLLPDDKHFNSKNLLRLFLKPKARVGPRRQQKRHQELARKDDAAIGEINEAFWANRANEDAAADDEIPVQGNYDADFFNDDALPFAGGFMDDDDDFADARDHFSPVPSQVPIGTQATDVLGSQANAFGADLISQSRRFRPEYMQYARAAKKVDVKKLKDNLWSSMGLEKITAPPAPEDDDPSMKDVSGTLKFTDVVNNLKQVYSEKVLSEISTSYCFICTLHLANEQGLVIENTPDYENLIIRKDFSADLSIGH